MKTDLDQRSIFYSVCMHLAVLLFAIAGLPSACSRSEPEPVAISVEILPVSAMSNVKPSDLPLAKKEAPPKPTPKATPVKAAPPKPAEPKKETVPLPKPTPVKEAIKKEEKKPDPPKEQPKEQPKSAEKTPEPKNEKDALDEILKNVRADAQKTEQEDPKAKPEKTGTTMKGFVYDPSKAPSMSERDAIIQQFIRCWNPPAGVKNDYTLKVVVKAMFNPDGTLAGQPVLAAGQSGMMSQANFRAAADSALRAVARCAPLKNLDPSKHAGWGEMELTFDPSFLY